MMLLSGNCEHFNSNYIDENVSDCAQNMTEGLQQMPDVPRYIQVISTVFFSCIFVLGVFGNLLVIMVVILNRNMKTSVNMYLINLCIADLLVLTVCMPPVLVDVYARDVWYFGETMCSVVPFLENTVAASSVLTLTSISMERYRVVCHPLKGMKDDIGKSGITVLFIWIFSALSNVPWFYIAKFRDSNHLDGTPIKVCRTYINLDWQKTFAALQCALFFAIPFTVLLILYTRVCFVLHYTQDDAANKCLTQPSHERNRRQLRIQVINIILCLVLLFFLFHLPYRVVSMWFTFAKEDEIHGLGIEQYFNILYSARTLFYLNHAINPIIYNFVSTKFRNALKSVLKKRGNYGSFSSANRRNVNTSRPAQSRMVQEEQHLAIELNQSCVKRCAVQKKNDFYPMYALLIKKHDTNS